MNSVLQALSPGDFASLKPNLEPVALPFRQRLQETNRTIKHAYFPRSGLASVVAISGRERRQAEVGIVGNEGFTGIPAILDAVRAPCEVFMQVEGEGYRIDVGHLNVAIDASVTMRRIFMRAVHISQVQSNFNALASAQGKVEERLARWLLMAHDRVRKDTIELTHEFVALMLGVRRAGVTQAVHALEQRGLVTGLRGAITLRDREGLEEMATGFYGQPEAEFERLFPH